jgi:acetate kinase
LKILVLNCGSSSVKYQFIDSDTKQALAKGQVERIGMTGAILTHTRADGDHAKLVGEIADHQLAIEYILAILLSPNHGVIGNRSEIDAVGHRVVHGGEDFKDSVIITPDVMEKIEECIELAPLHNPHNIRGIKACQSQLPSIPQVAVFDTAFHSNMPPHAYIYGLPYVLYKRYGIRRYGFHGTSHHYVSRRAAELMNKPIDQLNIVTCHLGNGCSIAAVKGGVSIDTSMGFTPMEGLLMGTRTGDLDTAAILHIMGREELSLAETNAMMNKHSGLQGISGVSSDMRDIESEMAKGHDRAKLAFHVFCYRLKKYICAYVGAMGGIDVLVFTGGIGEHSPQVRESSCQGLDFIGITVDRQKNRKKSSPERPIHAGKVSIFVIPTNEELVIAEDTARLVKKPK